MTIKAVLRDGRIQPTEPIPADWTDGQELVIEDPDFEARDAQLEQWAADLDKATEQVPPDEHDRFLFALRDIERESKEAVRREWGM